MSNIFDWDEEEDEKQPVAEPWGTRPLAQPPAEPQPPGESAVPLTNESRVTGPLVQPEPAKVESELWNEAETVLRPRPERSHHYPNYESEPAPQKEHWAEFQPDAFDQQTPPAVWSEYPAETPEETARKGGMAWSAGIVFFSSVAFMLFLGWIFDYLFASSPWGLVVGIVVGSILGFVQFFRISSRIFNPKKGDLSEHPLMPPEER
jgi:F0F1-type ATP synthase assembly protein I